jgi:uncharacterized integral membrane protein
MNKVRINKLSFSSHLLYLSLTGAIGGAIYGLILLVIVVMNVNSISFDHIPFMIGTFLGPIISGSVLGLLIALVSYKFINRILCGNFCVITGSISDEK